jgi:hypothetical protein
VPAIDPNVLDCVFYVYPDVSSAEQGKAVGGTGFFVGVPLKKNSYLKMIYAVTNKHCIAKSESRVVLRVNMKTGKPDLIPTKVSDWKPHPAGLDIVALQIMLPTDYAYNFISTDMFFITPEIIKERWIGPGDDVFMAGRFIGHDGELGNLPTARFGNISRMNSEPLKDPNGVEQDSFLVEMKSIPGYSGSPVFVRIDLLEPRPPDFDGMKLDTYSHHLHGPWLLGIDWSHLSNFHPVLSDDKRTKMEPREWVEMNTGMAGVIPAWRIKELLDLEEFQMQRKNKDEEISNNSRLAGSASFDSAEAESAPFTESDFEAALRKVSRRVGSSESDEGTK